MLRHRTLRWAGVVVCLLGPGCNNKKKGELVSGAANPLTESAAFKDTISEAAWVEGLRRMQVRGYGLVAGLGTRGSSECPPNVRRRLLQDMYKMEQFAKTGRDALPVTPEQIIDDRDTAVVTVEGEIPAAAQAGDHFDLEVKSLSGTQTVSLQGGRLYDCELRIYQDTGAGSVAGKALAMGSGPVFINPWSQSESAATRSDPRVGTILGGGRVTEARRIRLVLENPSYRRAVRIAECINTRFPGRDKVADGQSPSHVKLNIPPEYADDPQHFLELVRHLYLPTTPGFLDRRAAELVEELLDPDAPHADIALALEGIGRTTLPLLEKLYTDSRDYVSFHAALAAMRLEDKAAVEAVAAHARDPRSRYRIPAVRALTEVKDIYRTTVPLRELLDDPDPRIRVLAYEGLLAREDRTVQSTPVGGDNFHLDLVRSNGGNLIYAKRSRDRRIALFGERVACTPPLFYCDEDGKLTIMAEDGDERLTLLRKTRRETSPPVSASLGAAELIPMLGDLPTVEGSRFVRGLNVPYSLVVKALADLCRARSINADFMMEQPTVAELFGPLRETSRGESDL